MRISFDIVDAFIAAADEWKAMEFKCVYEY